MGMRRRDEAYAAILSAVRYALEAVLYMSTNHMFCSAQQEQIRSLSTEVDNYKKSILKEEERNEELTMMLNKVNADIAHVNKQIEASMAKKDRLKAEYMTYTRTLQETEQALAKATTVSTKLKIVTISSTTLHFFCRTALSSATN